MSDSQFNQKQTHNYYQDDEITLKELILKLGEFWKELWKYKFWIIAASLLSAALSYGNIMRKNISYTSGLSFTIAENNEDRESIFYIPEVAYYSRGVDESNRVTELVRSGRIIHKMLLERTTLNEEDDFIGNHLIQLYEYDKIWNEQELSKKYEELNLRDFKFTHQDLTKFTAKEKRALIQIHELISGNKLSGRSGLLNVLYNGSTKIFRLDLELANGDLGLDILDRIYKEISEFYVEQTVGKSLEAYDQISEEADSIKQELQKAEANLAYASDRNRGITASVQSLNLARLTRRLGSIQTEHDRIIGTKKELELELKRETPIFQVIDRTFFPIRNSPSKSRAILIGIFVGGFLMTLILFGRKIVRDALAS